MISVVAGALVLEIASFILSMSGLLLINDTPRIYLSVLGDEGTGMAWRNEKSSWGAWHKINATDTHITRCFNVRYESNSVGARDREYAKKSPSTIRYVLLGDSFAEGFGVDFEKTAKVILEKSLGAEILNFGASGDFGPLQYYLVYRELAKDFEHNRLILFFSPANDFFDNDYSVWRANGWTFWAEGVERYRPYSRKDDSGDYAFFYPEHAVKRDNWETQTSPDSSITQLKGFLLKYLWTSNTLRTAKIIFGQMQFSRNDEQAATTSANFKITKSYSGYFDASEDQQLAAVYWITKIVRESDAERIIIVSIPTMNDFIRIKKGAVPSAQLWQRQLNRLQDDAGGRVRFIDLAGHPPRDIEGLYLSCDGHWSETGNRWAAEIIGNELGQL
jgi:hypothetical protein